MADIVLSFKGAEYRLPASRSFEACLAIEDVATVFEISKWYAAPQFAKMAKATGILLRMAGAKVSDEEVKAELMAAYRDLRHDAVYGCLGALTATLFDGVPPAAVAKDDAAGKPEASSDQPS